jgi:hypothetical protein
LANQGIGQNVLRNLGLIVIGRKLLSERGGRWSAEQESDEANNPGVHRVLVQSMQQRIKMGIQNSNIVTSGLGYNVAG